MKSYLKISNTSLVRFCVLGVVTLGLMTSCDKNADSGNAGSGASASLSIKVEGIENEVDIAPKAMKASNSKTSTQLAPGVLEEKDVTYKEFDAVVRLQQDQVEGDRTVSNSQVAKSNGKSATKAIAMDRGVKYRLLLYKDGKFITSLHAESGVASHVEVVKNEEYQWYAYSYNSTDNIPDVANPAAPVIESVVDKPLLYASGTVTVTGAGTVDKPLLVRFAHRTARIGAELSARGMIAGLQTITAKFANTDYIKKGTLNVFTGQYENTSTVDVGNLTFTNYSVATKDTIKVAYYYTAAQTPIVPMTVNVETFTVKLDNNSTRTFSTPFQYAMDMTAVNWGNRLTNSMDLIESALSLVGLQWSRANLYFSTADKAYRFRHMIEIDSYPRDGEEFWEYRSSFPTSAANKQDPCTRVYPLNKWRMPTKSETKILTDRTAGRNLQPDYVEYDAVGVAAPYQGNKVRILKLGYFMTVLGPMDYRNDGYFWTHDPAILGGILGGVESYRVSDNRSVPIIGDYVWMHGFQSTMGGRENIRCVRK